MYGSLMHRAMQDWSMRISHVIDHAAREAGVREIVTRWADGSETRTTWAGIRAAALKMAQALKALGIGKGDRVASLAIALRSEEHTSELQSLMHSSYAVFCL